VGSATPRPANRKTRYGYAGRSLDYVFKGGRLDLMDVGEEMQAAISEYISKTSQTSRRSRCSATSSGSTRNSTRGCSRRRSDCDDMAIVATALDMTGSTSTGRSLRSLSSPNPDRPRGRGWTNCRRRSATYYYKFSPKRKRPPDARLLTGAFADMNRISRYREAFRDMVEGLDLNTAAGPSSTS